MKVRKRTLHYNSTLVSLNPPVNVLQNYHRISWNFIVVDQQCTIIDLMPAPHLNRWSLLSCLLTRKCHISIYFAQTVKYMFLRSRCFWHHVSAGNGMFQQNDAILSINDSNDLYTCLISNPLRLYWSCHRFH